MTLLTQKVARNASESGFKPAVWALVVQAVAGATMDGSQKDILQCRAWGSAMPISSTAIRTTLRAMKSGSSPASNHPGQIVERRVRIGAAHGFVQGRDQVVVAIL